MALEAAAIKWSGIGIEVPLEELNLPGEAPRWAPRLPLRRPPPALTPRRVRKAAVGPPFEPG